LRLKVHPQAIGDAPIDVEREITRHRKSFTLETQGLERNATPAERVGIGIADPLAQYAALEDAVIVEFPCAARSRNWEQQIVIHLRQSREFLTEEAGISLQEFEGHQEIARRRFILQNCRHSFAVALKFGGAHACALGDNQRAGGREVTRVEGLALAKTSTAYRNRTQTRSIEGRRTVARISQLRGIGAGDQLGLGIANLHANRTGVVFERGRAGDRKAGRPFLGQIAIVTLDRARNMRAAPVERLAGDEIDRPCDPAFDHVGGEVLEHLDTAQQFGRDVVETENGPTRCRKNVAAIEFGPDERQAAHDHARPFNRETVRIRGLFEATNIDTRNALQRFGDRPIRQRPNVFCGDDVNEGIGVTLDVLRAGERSTKTASDDNFAFGDRFFLDGLLGVTFVLRQCRRGSRGRNRDGRGSAQSEQTPARREACVIHDVSSLP